MRNQRSSRRRRTKYSTTPTKKDKRCTRDRALGFEELEPRQMLAADPIGNEFLVNSFVSGTQRLWDESSAIAERPDGGFTVVFSGKGTGDSAGIYLRGFDTSGNPLAGQTRVNATTDGEQVTPSIATNSSGNFIVVWSGK